LKRQKSIFYVINNYNLSSKLISKPQFYYILLFSIFLLIPGCVTKTLFNLYDLPKPNGTYNIGTIQFDWINPNYQNLFSENIYDKRRIMVQFWFPGTSDESLEPSLYADNSIVIEALSNEYKIPPNLLKKAKNIKTNSYHNLKPIMLEGIFPLIIFSHGKGGYKSQNTVQFEELASNGYIVVSVDHSYDAMITVFSDGSIAPYVSDNPKKVGSQIEADKITNKKLLSRVSDIRYVLDKICNEPNYHPLFNLIDTSKVGMFGHSFGVTTTVLSAQTDNRIKVIAGLDGWFEPLSIEQLNRGLKIPFMHLGREKWRFNPTNYENMEQLSSSSPTSIIHYPIKRLQHFDFMDGTQLASTSIKIAIPHLSSYNKYKVRNLLNEMLLTYFNYELKSKYSDTTNKIAKRFKLITD